MVNYDDMPEDNADLAFIKIDFPRLSPDSSDACPASVDSILEYLTIESLDEVINEAQLKFLQTALVEDHQYWIWEFIESEGKKRFVTVSLSPTGNHSIGYAEDYYNLTPEQFILGDYHKVF